MNGHGPRRFQGTKPPLFPLGACVATPAAITAIIFHGLTPGHLLARHVTGDWGDVDEDDTQRNDAAVQNGGRILSAYVLADDETIWVITEADRSSTCLLLPSEY